LVANVFEHESGHAMLLAHDEWDGSSIMYPIGNSGITTPDTNDIGASPGCQYAGFGLRCIYGSGD
jgi:hypothetical protein